MQFRAVLCILVLLILLFAMLVAGCTSSTSPTATPQASASAITALQGYPIAEKAAKTVYNDAIIDAAMGSTLKTATGTAAAIDGRSSSWLYTFVSASAQKDVTVEVYTNLSCKVIDAGKSRTLATDTLARLRDIHPASDWKVDSDQVVRTALPLYMEKFGTNPRMAIYTFINARNFTGSPLFYWAIMFQGGAHETVMGGNPEYVIDSLTVWADPTTGAIIPPPEIIPVP